MVALLILLAHLGAGIWLAAFWFGRFRLGRPPIGVFDLSDVLLALTAIVLAPVAYLAAPTWLAVGVLALACAGVLSAALEPLIKPALWAWAAAAAMVGGDMLAASILGPHGLAFLAVNNVLMVAVAAAVANLWVQGGLRARDAAVLAAGLTVFDVVATSWLPLMDRLGESFTGALLAPMLAWPSGSGVLSMGLGDALLAVLFPVVMRKAYGARAGAAAAAMVVGLMGVMLSALALGAWRASIPAMALLGPAMVVQVMRWRRTGPEQGMKDHPVRADGAARATPSAGTTR